MRGIPPLIEVVHILLPGVNKSSIGPLSVKDETWSVISSTEPTEVAFDMHAGHAIQSLFPPFPEPMKTDMLCATASLSRLHIQFQCRHSL